MPIPSHPGTWRAGHPGFRVEGLETVLFPHLEDLIDG